MSFGIAVFIAAFMVPSAMCLYYAWRAWAKLRMDSTKKGWRERLLMVGVVVASICQLMVTAFLFTGFRSGGQSFATRVSLPWAIANWASLLSWIISLAAATLGKGSIRRPLLIWCLVTPAASWIIFMMGYDY
jgi:hypothetical protein